MIAFNKQTELLPPRGCTTIHTTPRCPLLFAQSVTIRAQEHPIEATIIASQQPCGSVGSRLPHVHHALPFYVRSCLFSYNRTPSLHFFVVLQVLPSAKSLLHSSTFPSLSVQVPSKRRKVLCYNEIGYVSLRMSLRCAPPTLLSASSLSG